MKYSDTSLLARIMTGAGFNRERFLDWLGLMVGIHRRPFESDWSLENRIDSADRPDFSGPFAEAARSMHRINGPRGEA
jgi:hypothetical protein